MLGEYVHLGGTRDDAAGEAFDKVAKMMGLGYPGGRIIDNLAKAGNPKAVRFPRARLKNSPYEFSFSGIKTAAWHYLKEQGEGAVATAPGRYRREFSGSGCRHVGQSDCQSRGRQRRRRVSSSPAALPPIAGCAPR